MAPTKTLSLTQAGRRFPDKSSLTCLGSMLQPKAWKAKWYSILERRLYLERWWPAVRASHVWVLESARLGRSGRRGCSGMNWVSIKEFKRGMIRSLFDPCSVNAMERQPYWLSPMEASYCTFGFGVIIRHDLLALWLPCDSPCDNQYAYA